MPLVALPATANTDSEQAEKKSTEPIPAPAAAITAQPAQTPDVQPIIQTANTEGGAPNEVSPLQNERSARSENPVLSPQYWARLGAGISQSEYAQSMPQFVDISVSDNLGPTLILEAGAWWSWHWGVDAYFRNTPGEIISSPFTEVQNGHYNFRRAGIEILYRSHPLKKERNKETFLKLGIHQHDLPFLSPVTPVVLSQRTNRIRTFGLGIEHHRAITETWRLEGFLRYQYPYTSGVTPHFTVDGSLGVVHRLPDNWSVSLFWTGEWHDYKYEAGYQNLFQSNFDLRVGVEF